MATQMVRKQILYTKAPGCSAQSVLPSARGLSEAEIIRQAIERDSRWRSSSQPSNQSIAQPGRSWSPSWRRVHGAAAW